MQETTPEYLHALFEAQKKAFLADINPSLGERLERLQSLEEMMLACRHQAQQALERDFSSHPAEMTDLLETGAVIARVRYIKQHLADWMKPSFRPLDPPVHGQSEACVIRQPLGVLGNISPWNFPIECSLVMVADMLAAGNRVIVKLSEHAPATAEVLQREAGNFFSPEILAIVTGGPELSRKFASLPWDHLTYIGGSKVGKLVMRAASENLTPVTLEMGGKNPVVFAEDALQPDLVRDYLSCRVVKSGQVCTSPDYAFVPADTIDQFVDLVRQTMQSAYPRYIGHPDVVGMINKQHYDRILAWIEEARTRGVRTVPLHDEKPDPVKRQIPIHLVVNPPEDLSCMKEEIFGPIIPILPYRDIDEAIAYINARPRPLAAYIMTRSRKLGEYFANSTISGGCAINTCGLQGAEPCIPFGGIGPSGMGCHSGMEGFLNYSHSKSVYRCGEGNLIMKALQIPYGKFTSEFCEAIFQK